MSNVTRPHSGVGELVVVPGLGVLAAYGTTVPSDGATGYATGCTLQHTDGGANTSLYVNEGSATSADLNAK